MVYIAFAVNSSHLKVYLFMRFKTSKKYFCSIFVLNFFRLFLCDDVKNKF
jgi:hypothetical protein